MITRARCLAPCVEAPLIIEETKMAQAPTAGAARDVVVTPQNPLYVTDADRTFNKVTIQPGGQVHIQTQADVRIETLVKQE
jgi:hypothetical protein